MSPRAAWRLEQMGFETYDYVAGKADWISAGWETERADNEPHRAGDALDTAVATCAPTDAIETIRSQVEASGSVLVVNEQRILLGRVGPHQLHDAAAEATAESVMQPGPTTVRLFEPLEPLRERMAKGKVSEVVVTTSEGELIGVVRAE